MAPHSPPFAEPWQARVFALVVTLNEQGVFSWPQWSVALSEAIERAQQPAASDAGLPTPQPGTEDASSPSKVDSGRRIADLGEATYERWLDALESLLIARGLAAPLALTSLRQAWRLAAETTPHGQSIELQRSAMRRFRSST